MSAAVGCTRVDVAAPCSHDRRVARRENYFWTPRGDARVVANRAGRVTLRIALASYGPGAASWDVDRFNSVEFFALQCVVGFWSQAKYSAAIRSVQATPALLAAVARHKHADELDRLDDISGPDASEADWYAFSEAAERIVVEAALERQGGVRRTLTLRAADRGWVAHMGPLRDWCLG